MHPVARLVTAGLAGRFPEPDGGWHRVDPWRPGTEAVLAFTGHAVLAVEAEVDLTRLVERGLHGYGGAHDPRVLLDLSGPAGWVDCVDVLLARRGAPGPSPLVERPDLADHPRAAYARELRDDVRVLGPADRERSSLATVSRGIGGLAELSVELDPAERGRGGGAALIRAAVAAVPPEEVVVAAVAPGNAASLRAFLGCGFRPLGSVQLIKPGR